MSARRMRRDAARRAIRAARRAARASGCTCHADVEIRNSDSLQSELPHVDIAHDPCCALLRAVEGPGPARRLQLVVDLDPDAAA